MAWAFWQAIVIEIHGEDMLDEDIFRTYSQSSKDVIALSDILRMISTLVAKFKPFWSGEDLAIYE